MEDERWKQVARAVLYRSYTESEKFQHVSDHAKATYNVFDNVQNLAKKLNVDLQSLPPTLVAAVLAMAIPDDADVSIMASHFVQDLNKPLLGWMVPGDMHTKLEVKRNRMSSKEFKVSLFRASLQAFWDNQSLDGIPDRIRDASEINQKQMLNEFGATISQKEVSNKTYVYLLGFLAALFIAVPFATVGTALPAAFIAAKAALQISTALGVLKATSTAWKQMKTKEGAKASVSGGIRKTQNAALRRQRQSRRKLALTSPGDMFSPFRSVTVAASTWLQQMKHIKEAPGLGSLFDHVFDALADALADAPNANESPFQGLDLLKEEEQPTPTPQAVEEYIQTVNATVQSILENEELEQLLPEALDDFVVVPLLAETDVLSGVGNESAADQNVSRAFDQDQLVAMTAFANADMEDVVHADRRAWTRLLAPLSPTSGLDMIGTPPDVTLVSPIAAWLASKPTNDNPTPTKRQVLERFLLLSIVLVLSFSMERSRARERALRDALSSAEQELKKARMTVINPATSELMMLTAAPNVEPLQASVRALEQQLETERSRRERDQVKITSLQEAAQTPTPAARQLLNVVVTDDIANEVLQRMLADVKEELERIKTSTAGNANRQKESFQQRLDHHLQNAKARFPVGEKAKDQREQIMSEINAHQEMEERPKAINVAFLDFALRHLVQERVPEEYLYALQEIVSETEPLAEEQRSNLIRKIQKGIQDVSGGANDDFFIPDDLKELLDRILGRVIDLQLPAREEGQTIGLGIGDEMEVTEVYEESLAHQAGFESGDRILSIDGKAMSLELASTYMRETHTPLQFKVERIGV